MGQRSNQRHRPLPRTQPTGSSGDRAHLPTLGPVVCLLSNVLRVKINKKGATPATYYEDFPIFDSASDPSLVLGLVSPGPQTIRLNISQISLQPL